MGILVMTVTLATFAFVLDAKPSSDMMRPVRLKSSHDMRHLGSKFIPFQRVATSGLFFVAQEAIDFSLFFGAF